MPIDTSVPLFKIADALSIASISKHDLNDWIDYDYRSILSRLSVEVVKPANIIPLP